MGGPSSGLRSPVEPPEGVDSLSVALFYVDFYESEFSRARQVVKSRSKRVVVWTAALNGIIAMNGALIAISGFGWLGLGSTLLASLIGVIAAWDGHFRHRELWIQRSLVLGEIQKLSRNTRFRCSISGVDKASLAEECLTELNRILDSDFDSWSTLRSTNVSADGANAESG